MNDSAMTFQGSPLARVCRYCGRPFKAPNGLTHHLKRSHPEHFAKAVTVFEYPIEPDGTILIDHLQWVRK